MRKNVVERMWYWSSPKMIPCSRPVSREPTSLPLTRPFRILLELNRDRLPWWNFVSSAALTSRKPRHSLECRKQQYFAIGVPRELGWRRNFASQSKYHSLQARKQAQFRKIWILTGGNTFKNCFTNALICLTNNGTHFSILHARTTIPCAPKF